MPKSSIHWLGEPEAHNYPAAQSYLSLVFEPDKVAALMLRFHTACVTRFKAKDVFRASRLSLLGVSNLHIEKVRRKISRDKPLSPILLVRDPSHSQVIVADGYHRMCAIYGVNEDAWIQCKIV